jgi:predicted outer membrane protein
MKSRTLIALLVLLAGLVSCKKHEAPPPTVTAIDTTPAPATIATATMALDNPDKQFVSDAEAAMLAELLFVQTGEQRAAGADVKVFAHHITTDLTPLDDGLKAFAQKNVVAIPTQVAAKQIAQNDALEKLSGKKFDQAFLERVAADYTAMILLYDAESRIVADDGLRRWIDKVVPILHAHLDQARKLEGQIARLKY